MKTSYGQTLLKNLLDKILVEKPIENYRPDWLFGMELDLFYRKSRLAFEFQGDQHFEAGIFGDKAELKMQRDRDNRKAEICRREKIFLVIVLARDLSPKSLWGKLAWKAKIFRKLKGKRLLHRHSEMLGASALIKKEARAYKNHLIEKFDSATARRGIERANALKRHVAQSEAMKPF